MACEICGQKMMNCDCTARERELCEELSTVEETLAQFIPTCPSLIVEQLKTLSEDERMEVFGQFCMFCGRLGNCVCMRDE